MNSSDRRTFLTQTVGALAGIALVPDPARAAPRWQGGTHKAGLIGVGRQGRAIITELQKIPIVEVAALCDSSASRLESALGRTKGAEGFADHRALLDRRPDVDLVIVATHASASRHRGGRASRRPPRVLRSPDRLDIALIANATQRAAQGELKAGAGPLHPSLDYALADFVRSATEGAPLACPAEEGANATIVAISANQAVVSGRVVEVPSLP